METTISPLRPPAVPLVVCDPYLSVWSMNDHLTDQWTKHWTGKNQSLCGLIRIDGTCYRFMGGVTHYLGVDVPLLQQTAVEVLPTRTLYTFEGAGIRLHVTFLTPLLPQDLEVMARPVTYLDLQVEATDEATHEVALYVDVASNWVVNTPDQLVVWGRHRVDNLELLWMGSSEQAVLGKAGDDLRIDWGYLYTVAAPDQPALSALGADTTLRRTFAQTGVLPTRDDLAMPRRVGERPPMTVSAWAFAIGPVEAQPVTRQLLIAYDDQFAVEYMYRKLRPYWRRNGLEIGGLIETALHDYADLRQRCEAFDQELMADLNQVGGEAYARLAALSFRQCIAAHKLVADLDGTLLFFSKENFSNGCMGTVDITYPSSPFFLLFNPALLEAQLTPVLDYAASPRWRFPYAPHDVGRYPLANGQVYGGGETSEIAQMPVEESGNMLLLVAALTKVHGGSLHYANRYWALLRQWAAYLVEKGLDPENQLCTDDFAGRLAHNVNLSLKAILGIAAYAQLCQKNNLANEAAEYRGHAEAMMQAWLQMADDGDHYRLTFTHPGSWSQKYNLVWDKLLGLNLFPAEVAQKEIAFYLRQEGRYGLPLDNRSAYTKLDWIVWSASLTESPEDFRTLIAPVYKWLNETESRVPLCDWYYTDSGRQAGFQARSVVGGVFIPMLHHSALWQKWLPQ
ncbi:MAG: DUF4965 domain-containing protein [Caldilineaceae bacterium]